MELNTPEQIESFLSTCQEFLAFIYTDCAGLSPGAAHFKQSAEGLEQVKASHPERVALLDQMIAFYSTLSTKAPGARGSMYPRGSVMFDDLKALEALDGAMGDWLEELS